MKQIFLLIIGRCWCQISATIDAAEQPNIVYILADDLGYGDLGSYGQELIRTPRLDQLAAEGMRFTQHYSGAPSCHPSRCVLFTGKHTGHARIRAHSKPPLHPEDYTFSQMFQQAGYATGGVGKWALGDADTDGAPWRKGMDEFFGYLDQTHAHTYYPDFLWRDGQRLEIAGNQEGKRTVYSHDLFADQTLDFIRRHQDQPFFFYTAFTIPHAEVTVPDDSLAEYLGKWPEPKAFPGSKTYCPQDKPRAVRAAMIARWPGKIAAGSTSDRVSDFADMFPTFAEVIDTKYPDGLDGVSILPTLLGQEEQQADGQMRTVAGDRFDGQASVAERRSWQSHGLLPRQTQGLAGGIDRTWLAHGHHRPKLATAVGKRPIGTDFAAAGSRSDR